MQIERDGGLILVVLLTRKRIGRGWRRRAVLALDAADAAWLADAINRA